MLQADPGFEEELASLMHRYPDQLRCLLVHGGSSLNAEMMLGLFHFGPPCEDEQRAS